MSRATKGEMIRSIRERIGDARDFVVVDVSKLDANASNNWRLTLAEKEISAFTVKNSLARLALKESGVGGLDSVLQGPSTLVWGGEDIVALSKEISKWAKDVEQIQIKGGTSEGTTLSAGDVEKLSKSPGRMELLSIISGQILSPGAKLAAALLGPGGALASQIKSLADEEKSE